MMNLKKWFMAAALGIAPAMTYATTFAVWPAAADGEVQIPNEFNHWYNFTPTEVEIDGVQAMKCAMTLATGENGETLTNASAGWLTLGSTGFDISQLAGKDLVFDAMVQGAGAWTIRLTAAGPEQDMPVAVPCDGQFHTVRYNMATDFTDVNAKWASAEALGENLFTFATVGVNLDAGSALYFTNVRYEDAVPVPVVKAEAVDITATSARLVYSVEFADGYTNTVVTVNGESAEPVADMKFDGLTPKTSYSYTIVATGEYAGQTYTATKEVKFTTAREAGDLPVWHGLTDIDGFSAEYSITYNADKTLTVNALIETEKETPAADRNFFITGGAIEGGEEWLKLADLGDNMHTGTTTKTFEDGAVVTWRWYLPHSEGVYQQDNTYVAGSENEAPLAVRVKASARNITYNSAEIEFDVTVPAGVDYKVFYKQVGGETNEALANPIRIENLTERTEYAYEVYAIATVSGETVESRHAAVPFRTPSENPVEYVYSDLFAAVFTNAYLIGEDESQRRDIATYLPWRIKVDENQEAVYAIDLSQVENVVGLVPRLWAGNFYDLTRNAQTGWYECNLGKVVVDAETAVSHLLPYNGGGIDVRTAYTTWGMEKKLVDAVAQNTTIDVSVQNVTFNSAEVTYDLHLPIDVPYDVYYSRDDAEAIRATGNPISITGLEERTEYAYQVYAVLTADGETTSTDTMSVTFRTPAENPVYLVYADLLPVEFNNARYNGEDQSLSRTICVNLPWQVTMDEDGVAVYAVDLQEVENLEGFAPSIYWNGFRSLTKNEETGWYEYNFGQQEVETPATISHYIEYEGGKLDSRASYTEWGMERTRPEVGPVVTLALFTSKTAVLVNDEIALTVVAKDEAGYYVTDSESTLSSLSDYVLIDGYKARLTGKCAVVITATMGNLSADVEVRAIASPEAINRAAGVTGVTDIENVIEGEVANATDDDRESQIVWSCADTHNHYLVVDLGNGEPAHEGFYIEAVEVYFEGAYASEFTVTLSSQAPAELGASATALALGRTAAANDVVFANETNGVQHYFTQDPTETHRYVTLRTSQALNAEWGIKLRDFKVYATASTPTTTGVENINVDNAKVDDIAPVEYYNLNGVRVNNPSKGIYLRRQGSSVTKVIVR